MIIKVDVDGVLRNLVQGICSVYNDVFFENVSPEDITDYDIDLSFPLVEKVLKKKPRHFFFNERAEDVFRYRSTALDNVKEALELLLEAGHQVVICSWQFSHTNRVATLEWLNDWDIPFSDICFTKDKWLINGDYIIDDNPEFLSDSREKANKLLVSQPYNMKFSAPDVIRCDNLLDAVSKILGKELHICRKEIKHGGC